MDQIQEQAIKQAYERLQIDTSLGEHEVFHECHRDLKVVEEVSSLLRRVDLHTSNYNFDLQKLGIESKREDFAHQKNSFLVNLTTHLRELSENPNATFADAYRQDPSKYMQMVSQIRSARKFLIS